MTDWTLSAPSPRWASRTTTTLAVTSVLAAAVFVAGLFVAPERVWPGYLMGFHVLTGLALSGPLWLAFCAISGARWTRPLEPVLRAMGTALPAAGIAGLVLVVGVPALYEWAHVAHETGAGPGTALGAVEHVAVERGFDPILDAKRAYLNYPFFAARMVAYFVLWIAAARYLSRATAREDGTPAEQHTRRMKAGAVFLLVFTPTFSLACTDWLLSLDPHWFSTIYALVVLSTTALAGLAAAIVLGVGADRAGRIEENQLGDIGALLLGIAMLWGYLWYSQYMLIWYTNLPEETFWYEARLAGAWGLLTKASLALGCVVPFVVMLFRRARRSRQVLVELAALVLLARLIDVYVLAGPPSMGDTPLFGVWELVGIVGPVCIFFYVALRALRRAAPATA